MSVGKMQHSLALQSKGTSADGGGGNAGAFLRLPQHLAE